MDLGDEVGSTSKTTGIISILIRLDLDVGLDWVRVISTSIQPDTPKSPVSFARRLLSPLDGPGVP